MASSVASLRWDAGDSTEEEVAGGNAEVDGTAYSADSKRACLDPFFLLKRR